MGDKAKVLYGTALVVTGIGVTARTIGYTMDGATMTVRNDFSEIKVEELSGTIHRPLMDAGASVSFTLAESALEDLAAAIPGSKIDLEGKLILGGQGLQAHRLTLIGKEPTNYRDRVIILYTVNPTGEVAIPFKKGEASVVPVTFTSLINDDGEFGENIDATAAPPTVVVGASTKSNALGTVIEVKFNTPMDSPVGKHLEFWFDEESIGIRAFELAALHLGDNTIFDLTVDGDPIVADKDLLLYYRIGSVTSVAGGILQNFAGIAVVARPL